MARTKEASKKRQKRTIEHSDSVAHNGKRIIDDVIGKSLLLRSRLFLRQAQSRSRLHEFLITSF
jgi:hypothetical protein